MLRALTLAHLESKLVYTHPAGVFNLIITLGIYIGIVLASPVVLYQIWLFVAPALYKHERSAVTGFLFSTVFLFLAGIAFGYYITLPYLLKFLVSFQNVSLPGIVPMITVNEYFDLTLMVLLGLGLVFELPVLVFFLTIFGIVTPQFLWKNIRYAIAIIAVVAAIITPTPDAMTMLIFMAPMLGLYFVGMGVSWVVVRSKNKKLAAEAAAASRELTMPQWHRQSCCAAFRITATQLAILARPYRCHDFLSHATPATPPKPRTPLRLSAPPQNLPPKHARRKHSRSRSHRRLRRQTRFRRRRQASRLRPASRRLPGDRSGSGLHPLRNSPAPDAPPKSIPSPRKPPRVKSR